MKEKSKGLGDTISKITKATGIDKVAKAVLGDEPMSVITSMGTYQKGFKPDELLEYVSDVLGNGYSVKKIKLSEKSSIPAIIITKKPQARLPLKETIPEALEKGKELKKDIAEEQLEQSPIKGLGVTLDEKTLDNIAEDEEVYGLVSDAAEQAANQARRYFAGAEKQLEGLLNMLERNKRQKSFDA